MVAHYLHKKKKKKISNKNTYKHFALSQIIILVRNTLKDLLLAIEGTIIMSEQLRDALDNIFNARVPEIWKRGSWLSSSLGFWFTELLERNQQFYTWCFSVSARSCSMNV